MGIDIQKFKKTSLKEWPAIEKLRADLPPVKEFDYALLPEPFQLWVKDVVKRCQCPPDFVAVTLMVAASAILGRKAKIFPKRQDNWEVVPNLWGALIGRPSSMKSPAMAEALKPLRKLAKDAEASYELQSQIAEIDDFIYASEKKAAQKALESAIAKADPDAIAAARSDLLSLKSPSRVTLKRYSVTDATIEKLGELLAENENGLLQERDELAGWLAALDREDRSSDRAFYLEAFNGNGTYTYDRIGRGTVVVPNMTLCLIGGIQPSKLSPYVWSAVNQSGGDDGLIQRLQLAVYPDVKSTWINVDCPPDRLAEEKVFAVFKALDELCLDEDSGTTRFDDSAQELFNDWRFALETKIREPSIHPAIESHLAKYRSLMPSLALIINEIEIGHMCQVVLESAYKALRWCDYLESHALRIYGGAISPAIHNAKTIFERRDKLPTQFTLRDIYRKGWAGLHNQSAAKKAVSELIDHNYCFQLDDAVLGSLGRPVSEKYFWNPRLDEDALMLG